MPIRIRLDETKTYTMRELNQRTAQVLDEINDSRAPAAITKHGRFVALITPLRDFEIEAMVLTHGRLADELNERATAPTPVTFTPEQVKEQVKNHHS
jgi:prevent-host-death family protein